MWQEMSYSCPGLTWFFTSIHGLAATALEQTLSWDGGVPGGAQGCPGTGGARGRSTVTLPQPRQDWPGWHPVLLPSPC